MPSRCCHAASVVSCRLGAVVPPFAAEPPMWLAPVCCHPCVAARAASMRGACVTFLDESTLSIYEGTKWFVPMFAQWRVLFVWVTRVG